MCVFVSAFVKYFYFIFLNQFKIYLLLKYTELSLVQWNDCFEMTV